MDGGGLGQDGERGAQSGSLYFTAPGKHWMGWLPQRWRDTGGLSGNRKLCMVVCSSLAECMSLMQTLSVVHIRLQSNGDQSGNVGFLGCDNLQGVQSLVRDLRTRGITLSLIIVDMQTSVAAQLALWLRREVSISSNQQKAAMGGAAPTRREPDVPVVLVTSAADWRASGEPTHLFSAAFTKPLSLQNMVRVLARWELCGMRPEDAKKRKRDLEGGAAALAQPLQDAGGQQEAAQEQARQKDGQRQRRRQKSAAPGQQRPQQVQPQGQGQMQGQQLGAKPKQAEGLPQALAAKYGAQASQGRQIPIRELPQSLSIEMPSAAKMVMSQMQSQRSATTARTAQGADGEPGGAHAQGKKRTQEQGSGARKRAKEEPGARAGLAGGDLAGVDASGRASIASQEAIITNLMERAQREASVALKNLQKEMAVVQQYGMLSGPTPALATAQGLYQQKQDQLTKVRTYYANWKAQLDKKDLGGAPAATSQAALQAQAPAMPPSPRGSTGSLSQDSPSLGSFSLGPAGAGDAKIPFGLPGRSESPFSGAQYAMESPVKEGLFEDSQWPSLSEDAVANFDDLGVFGNVNDSTMSATGSDDGRHTPLSWNNSTVANSPSIDAFLTNYYDPFELPTGLGHSSGLSMASDAGSDAGEAAADATADREGEKPKKRKRSKAKQK